MGDSNSNHIVANKKYQKMKLTNKQKRSVKRRVQLEQGVSTPGTRVFVSKKIYTRKKKHKNERDR